jgi:tRNA dimethylallyltransferase
MKRKLIIVLGPTASGKTEYSLSCAKYAQMRGKNVEIINADSRQLYKHMNIGTAKITASDMRDVPHHLFSVLDPKEESNIGWYKREAMSVIDSIHARGYLPILVGGSMLYISSIIDGLEPIPHDISGGIPNVVRSECPYDCTMIGMNVSREDLCRRINQRTENLLASGWIDEVRQLLTMGYTVDDPGFKACGYKEIVEEIQNHRSTQVTLWHRKSEISHSKLYEGIAMKTRQYAKRQMTWWKHDQRIRWVTPDTDREQLFFPECL